MAIRLHVTAVFSLNGLGVLPATCNFQFGLTGDMTSAECLTAGNALMTALASSTAFKASMGPTTRLDKVRLAVHNPDTGPETAAAESTATAVASTQTGTQGPPQSAIVATLRSATPGRSYRGRLYWPPGNSMPSSGEISSTVQTAINAGVQAFAQQVALAVAGVGPSTAWYIWSPTLGAGTAVSTVSVGTRIDTQRRRNSGLDTYLNFPVT